MKLQRILAIATVFLATSDHVRAERSGNGCAEAGRRDQCRCGSRAATGLLDINTATPDQLKQLPGIGDAYSKRIVDGRPYAAKTQLTSRGILPKATYDGIAGQIIAKHAK